MFWKVATGVLALAMIAAVVLGARFFMEREELAEALDLAEQQETSLARL